MTTHQNNNDKPQSGASLHQGYDWHRRAGPIFKWGIIVGFVLILLGGSSLQFSLTNEYLGNLIVCVGLGIILGAFGSTASINLPTQGIVLTGVAGLAIILFKLIIGEMNNGYLIVRIGPNIEPETQMLLRADRDFLGSYQKSGKTYDFVIFGKDIRGSQLTLLVTLPNKRELSPFDCISMDRVKPYLSSGQIIDWHLNINKDEGTLVDRKDGKAFAKSPCKDIFADADSKHLSSNKEQSRHVFSFISTALAADEPVQTDSVQTLIEQLDSEAINVRQDARSQLGRMGISVIDPLLTRLTKNDLTYRLQLGIIVAATEMMRENKNRRVEIINKIQKEELIKLVDAAVNEDRAIRVYASEFQYDLGDPRIIDLAFERFSSASENGRYNLLLIIKGAVPYASASEKQLVANKVAILKSDETPKTNELIDSIIYLAQQDN